MSEAEGRGIVLAAACWIRARVFICPQCATCAEALGGSTAGCARCIGPPPRP
jgi:hypothetical protein